MKPCRVRLLAMTLAIATGPVFAVDSTTATDAPDLSAVRTMIEARNFEGSIAALDAMIDRGVQHADVYNLLGFSLRKAGDTRGALTYYNKALDFDPNHKGALEYLGELYVEIGDLDSARANEARLATLCPQGCEELEDLRNAIIKASASARAL
jgi:Flp pilus assembly protein TadD